MISSKFTSFLNIALKAILLIITLSSLGFIIGVIPFSKMTLSASSVLKMLMVGVLFIALGIVAFYIINNNKLLKGDNKRSLILILIIAFSIRAIWIIFIETKPVSDFALMFEYGKQFANGDYSMFKGNNYIARFPHLTFYVVYLGMLNSLFSNPLVALKLINLLLSTANVYILYLICAELYNDKKKGIIAAIIGSIFPAFIIYSSVACTENVAMTFFLLSLYIFLLVIKKKVNYYWLLLSGFVLLIGNMFRSVAAVIMIAYLMYLVIYCYKDSLIKLCLLLIVSFIIPMLLINQVLLKADITEYNLWKGSEPSITSVLKGTNIKNKGMWNEEDANIVEKYNYDYDAINKASKEIIKERLTTTSSLNLIGFYIQKIVIQWSTGDFSGLSWSTSEVENKNIIYNISQNSSFYTQIIYASLVVLIYLGLYNKNSYRKNKEINLIYIIFCGYGLLYLITEMQPRYAYIVSWVFVILPLTCSEENIKYITSKIKALKRK
jgi:hypothetical protein